MSLRIYTRTGDAGQTGLFGGKRVRKDDLRIEACGAVDEMNALLGICRTHAEDAGVTGLLSTVQNTLFAIGADIATPDSEEARGGVAAPRLTASQTAEIEAHIDRLETELTPLSRFILPGGGALAANLHLARTICRRAERRCVALAAAETLNGEIVRYLNRLSDLLFVLARAANARAGIPDTPWEGGR